MACADRNVVLGDERDAPSRADTVIGVVCDRAAATNEWTTHGAAASSTVLLVLR